jgi:hypothetical protein
MARCPEETEVAVSSFPVLQLASVSELKTLDLWTGEELVWEDRKSCAVFAALALHPAGGFCCAIWHLVVDDLLY